MSTDNPVPVWDNYLYLTVDIVLFAIHQGQPRVLVVQRSADSDAYPGGWALPGGYVDAGERIEQAAVRELAEETGLTAPATWERVGIYDDPDRDPRGRVVSIAYTALLPDLVTPRAGDDVTYAAWADAVDVVLGARRLAFDHDRIVTDALMRMRRRLPFPFPTL